MPRKATKQKEAKVVDRQTVLEAFSEVKQLSSDKIGEVVASLVNDNLVQRKDAERARVLLNDAVSWSINTILASKGV